MQRCMAEAHNLDLRAPVLENYLYGNAQRVLYEKAVGAPAHDSP
jgi:hypothetical protein